MKLNLEELLNTYKKIISTKEIKYSALQAMCGYGRVELTIPISGFFPPMKPSVPVTPEMAKLEYSGNYPFFSSPADKMKGNIKKAERYQMENELYDDKCVSYFRIKKEYESDLTHNTIVIENFFKEIRHTYEGSALDEMRKLLRENMSGSQKEYYKSL